MKKAIILAIGNELVEGLIIDTNSKYLSQRLKLAGYYVERILTLPDRFDLLVKEIKAAVNDADLVVSSGGLGPTEDDLTREAFAQALGLKLELNESVAGKLVERALKFYGKAPENVKKQAMILEGAEILENTVGTAPGQFLKIGEKMVILLPGPPTELVPMFESVYERLKTDDALYSRRIKTLGIPEAVLMDEYGQVIYSRPSVTVATMASYERGVEVRLTASVKYKEDVDDVFNQLLKLLGKHVYATDDEEIQDVVARMLLNKGLTVSFAESCTGGMISSVIVDVPGISKVFKGSVVAYDNAVKISLLGVSEEVLKVHGAVSEECVRQMARGARRILGTDVALAVSGIAGPSGGTPEKPVGTVCVGIDGPSGTTSKTFLLRGERNAIRRRTTLVALNELRLYLVEL
ncbi:competence/damage-inducible protein A [Fervidobacterium thailandense]|uniref:CinA-like protein n=1 Tax=Fervidobacterium thailandense TaxID=1008305 RepID=A0A1E3G4K8_9BACT|nr:competence/damage-inducible protein A [Fervidobacterium thailandense]ODN31112.1 damage-inducible protein CinA [Fervidobacterium thailandense]